MWEFYSRMCGIRERQDPSWRVSFNSLECRGNYSATSNNWSWYTGRWWVGCYIWYSKEGTGRGRSLPRRLLAVPNVTPHPSTASVSITVLLHWSGDLRFQCADKGLMCVQNSGSCYASAVSSVWSHCHCLQRWTWRNRNYCTRLPHCQRSTTVVTGKAIGGLRLYLIPITCAVLSPVNTGDKVERTFDIGATKLTHFRQSRPSWTYSTLATDNVNRDTVDKVERAGDSRLSTNRRQIGDKVDSRLCRRVVAGFGDCRLCRLCVPGFKQCDWLNIFVDSNI